MSCLRQPLKICNFLLCAALLVSSVGCQLDSVTGPTDDGKNDLSGISSAPSGGPWSPAVTIGPAGGEISFANVTLVFPEGALSNDEHIVMRLTDRSKLRAEFGPHGLQFNRPVFMKMRLEGTSAESQSMEIKWFNPASSDWESITNIPSGDPNLAVAELEHFSKYGGDISEFGSN